MYVHVHVYKHKYTPATTRNPASCIMIMIHTYIQTRRTCHKHTLLQSNGRKPAVMLLELRRVRLRCTVRLQRSCFPQGEF